MNRLRALTVLVVLLAGATAVMAQSSASYRMEEAVFNSGGHPAQGATMASVSYYVSLDSLGEGFVGTPMSGAFYRIDSGFATAYLPPEKVSGLRFDSADTLA